MKIFFILLLLISCSHFSKDSADSSALNFLKPLWSRVFDPHTTAGNLPISQTGIFPFQGKLFFGDLKNNLVILDGLSGNVLWQIPLKGNIVSTPYIFEEKFLFVGTDESRVYLFDLASLTSTNKSSLESDAKAPLYALDLDSSLSSEVTYEGGRLFLQTQNHKLYCIDAKTGKILWGYRRPVSMPSSIDGSMKPFIYKSGNLSLLLSGFADGYLVAFNIFSGETVWSQQIISPSLSAVSFKDIDLPLIPLDKGILAIPFNDKISLLNPKTGVMVQRLDIEGVSQVLNGPRYIYLGLDSGEIALLDKESLQVIQKFSLTKMPSSLLSLAFFKNFLVVGTSNGELLAFDKEAMIKGHLSLEKRIFLGHSYSTVFKNNFISFLPTSSKVKGQRFVDSIFVIFSSRNRMYAFE